MTMIEIETLFITFISALGNDPVYFIYEVSAVREEREPIPKLNMPC